MHSQKSTDLAGLERFCYGEWDKIPAERVQRLLKKYPKRLPAVIVVKSKNKYISNEGVCKLLKQL